ncbi:MAG: class I SAM-dependent methyltransferase, partial [Oscillospiraceae bacterium]
HEKILGNNTFVYDYGETYCVWQNTLCEDHLVEMNLDIFVSDERGNYRRKEDEFAERAYSGEQIKAALIAAGLSIQAIYHEDSFLPPQEDSQRLIYVTKHCK